MADFADHLALNSVPEPSTGCLLWTGIKNQWNHGIVRLDGKTRSAHRLAWEIAHGPIPRGLLVCHKCSNGACINVEHLLLGNQSQMVLGNKTIAERLEANSIPEPNTGCTLWTGKLMKNGYAKLGVENRECYAHRLAWECAHGTIPSGMFVCHKCDTPSCVNVDHLFLGSAADNAHDCMSKGRQKTIGLKQPGESHHNSKLTEKDVIEIRQKAAASITRGTRAKLAREYGITTANLSIIVLRKGWKHLP